MLNQSQTVSVCIPTYNRAGLLRQAIDSVLQQTYQNFEIVVVDNASTDGTEGLVRSYTDGRIRYFRNHSNVGHRANWNLCLKFATGDYIAILPDDDAMLPENLAAKVAVLDQNPRVALVHSRYHLIDGDGGVFRENTNWGHGPERGQSGLEDRRHLLTAAYNLVNVSSAVFRRTCYEQFGGFTHRLRLAFDWEYFLRIAIQHDIYFLAEPLALWRVHAGSITSASVNQDLQKLLEDIGVPRLVAARELDHFPDRTQIVRQMGMNMATRVLRCLEPMVESDNCAEARVHLWKLCQMFPPILYDSGVRSLVLRAGLGARLRRTLKKLPFAHGLQSRMGVPVP